MIGPETPFGLPFGAVYFLMTVPVDIVIVKSKNIVELICIATDESGQHGTSPAQQHSTAA